MIHYWQSSSAIREQIFIPKYYGPEIASTIDRLSSTHDCLSVRQLTDWGILAAETGNEIGKAAYGTGDIPFVRTSDIANWEIKSAPKQGVSKAIYNEYAKRQDVQTGDILFVRDGTYLIGNNCIVTPIDKDILYQSHILKLRVKDRDRIDPTLLFLSLNSPFVQRQVRSIQFTADIIDTIGQRFFELVLPFPKSSVLRDRLVSRTSEALIVRMRGKAFVKHCPVMLEAVLRTGSAEPIESFLGLHQDTMTDIVANQPVSAEFGSSTSFWRSSGEVDDSIFLPKYYDTSIRRELDSLSTKCDLVSIRDLSKIGQIELHTGDEIGKMAYGTGDIPFIRTSDFSNWEINHNPKHSIAMEIYEKYAEGEDIQENDILLVRDGTYLVGSSCIITNEDVKSLYCGGLLKLRTKSTKLVDPFLMLGLLNSYIVKRQIRTKQFTRDVIDTIGNRIEEVVLPIPKSPTLRRSISDAVATVIASRMDAREKIGSLIRQVANDSPTQP